MYRVFMGNRYQYTGPKEPVAAYMRIGGGGMRCFGMNFTIPGAN
jgi:hypothetical protein